MSLFVIRHAVNLMQLCPTLSLWPRPFHKAWWFFLIPQSFRSDADDAEEAAAVAEITKKTESVAVTKRASATDAPAEVQLIPWQDSSLISSF